MLHLSFCGQNHGGDTSRSANGRHIPVQRQWDQDSSAGEIWTASSVTATDTPGIMQPEIIMTDRMELIPATPKIIESDLNNHALLTLLLNATMPASWPPAILLADVLSEMVKKIEAGTDPCYLSWYWVRTDSGAGDRMLIGLGGFAGASPEGSSAEIGYMVTEECQGQGYATEAVRCLIEWLFACSPVTRIIAHTLPGLHASMRVLEKNNFILIGESPEEGTIAYELVRGREHG